MERKHMLHTQIGLNGKSFSFMRDVPLVLLINDYQTKVEHTYYYTHSDKGIDCLLNFSQQNKRSENTIKV